jgi:hypothetical protein
VIFRGTNFNREFMKIWTNELMMYVYRSEGIDHIWSESMYCPTEYEFITNMMMKVSGFGNLLVGLMQSASSVKTDFRPFTDLLMAYAQLRDDYENLFMPEDYFEKRETFAEDLTLGKFTLPLIHAIQMKKNQEIIGKIQQIDFE